MGQYLNIKKANIDVDVPTKEITDSLNTQIGNVSDSLHSSITAVDNKTDNKVDKIIPTIVGVSVYTVSKDLSGETTQSSLSVGLQANGIPQYDNQGKLQSNIPLNNNDVATKQYVDSSATTLAWKYKTGNAITTVDLFQIVNAASETVVLTDDCFNAVDAVSGVSTFFVTVKGLETDSTVSTDNLFVIQSSTSYIKYTDGKSIDTFSKMYQTPTFMITINKVNKLVSITSFNMFK